MPSNLFIEPDAGADIPASSGNLGLGAESGLKIEKDQRDQSQTPLQSQSCYVTGGGSIGICLVATSAFKLSLSVEENPVSLRSVATSRAELRCSCCWNFNNINAVLSCYGLNGNLDLWKGILCIFMYLPICSLRLFFPLPFFFLVCVAPKLTSTLHELPLPVPNILSEIQPFQNFFIAPQNRQSKAAAVNINSYNRLIILLNIELLSEVYDDNMATILPVQSELGTSPAIVYVLDKSFISTVLFDGQGNSAIAIAIAVKRNDNNGITTLCFGKLSGARNINIKSDWNLVKFFAVQVQVLPGLVDAINEDRECKLYFCLMIG